MSALDTAKEIVRIGSTAGLSKDVIDLLEKKLALLTGELSDAHRRISELEIENGQLRAQVKNPTPVIKLDDTSRKVLQYFCDRNDVVKIEELAGHISCQASKAQYVCDGLSSSGFIRFASIPAIDPRWDTYDENSGYEITAPGRKVCFDHVG